MQALVSVAWIALAVEAHDPAVAGTNGQGRCALMMRRDPQHMGSQQSLKLWLIVYNGGQGRYGLMVDFGCM